MSQAEIPPDQIKSRSQTARSGENLESSTLLK
jgi:hypothetical protein